MVSLSGLRYRSGFCADCGNERLTARWWEHSYLCADCAGRRGYPRRAIFVCVLIGLSLFLLARARRHPAPLVTTPTVSAFDAVGDHRQPEATPEKRVRTTCGARTRRGTPCRRPVAPGERCAQHKGRPSILPAEREAEKN